jgi:hypothetical protein
MSLKRNLGVFILVFLGGVAVLVLGLKLAYATEITLTQSQIDHIIADNAADIPPEPIEPPVEPPVEPEPPSVCTNKPSGLFMSWQGVFSQGFPLPMYKIRQHLILGDGQYMAIKFNSRGVIDHGKITSPEHASSPGVRYGAISECPGDFDVASECKHRWGLGGGIDWSSDRSNGCRLKPQTTYYLNFKLQECNRSTCWFNLQHVNF